MAITRKISRSTGSCK